MGVAAPAVAAANVVVVAGVLFIGTLARIANTHTHTRAHAHTKWATPADEEKGRKATANSLLLLLPRLKWCVVVVAFIIDVATKKSLRGGATWCQVVAKLIKLTRSYHKFV